jgi:hypothetical protein
LNARIAVLFLAGVTFTAAKAQPIASCGDPQSLGMANSGVMLSSPWSGMNNPAGLPGIKDICFGLSYENSFIIPELGTSAFSCIIPTLTGNFGFTLASFGYSMFQTSQASLSYGKAFGNKFRAGIGLHYLYIHQPENCGSLFAFIPSAGIQILPSKRLVVGLHVFNPAHQQYNPEGYLDIPVDITAGAAYNLGDEVIWCTGAQKSSGEKIRIFSGFEVALQNFFLIRFGFQSGAYPELSFGLGFKSHHLNVDLALTRHPVLGINPALGITYII